MGQMNKILNYLLWASGLVTVAIFVNIYKNKYDSKTAPVAQYETNHSSYSIENKPDEKVNQYMLEVQQKLQRQQLQTSVNIKNAAAQPVRAQNAEKEIDPMSIPVEQQIWRDPAQEPSSGALPSNQINQKSYQDQVNNLQTEQARKQYAREFIENARKNGYHIKLSNTLEVISVEPIRDPQSQPEDTFESHPSE